MWPSTKLWIYLKHYKIFLWFHVFPKTTPLLPVWHRNPKRLNTPAYRFISTWHCLLKKAILTYVYWYLTVVLMWNSIMSNGVECLFMCLLDFHMFSLVYIFFPLKNRLIVFYCWVLWLLFFKFFIVIQLQLCAFSPHPSTPPQPNPPSPISTLPLDSVHVSFIVVPVIPSPHYDFFIYSEHKLFVRYVIYKYFSPIYALSPHTLCDFLHRTTYFNFDKYNFWILLFYGLVSWCPIWEVFD